MPSRRRSSSAQTAYGAGEPAGGRSAGRLAAHACVVAVALALAFGVPLSQTTSLDELRGRATDAVSSASVALDSPSGVFLVLINADRHPNAENLATWEHFFAGEEIGYLFEDISVVVPAGDATGLDMARSYQSRLPENQLTIRTETPTLLFSKAQHGRFDIMVLSVEVADTYDVASLVDLPNVITIESTDSGAVA